MGFWLEIVTLVVPGFNDSEQELREIAGFIAGVSPDIPWHVTAFHPDYKMTDREDTPVTSLLTAARAGTEAGLNYVYAGNRPGKVENRENTYCPACGNSLISRVGFHILENRLVRGLCTCGAKIPGIWNAG